MKYKYFITDKKCVLNHPYIDDCLIYDIETDSLDIDNANVKFVGFYSYKYKKYMLYNINERDKIQNLINEHRVLIGFNTKFFDNPIMENNGFNLDYKINFDCLDILYNRRRNVSNRESVIKLKNGKLLKAVLPNRKLKTIAKILDFPITKGDIDYAIFKKNVWNKDELKEIYKYLYYDINLTRMLFEFLVEYFNAFKDMVDDENIKRFNYIRSSPGSFAYNAICYLSGMPLEWEDDKEKNKIVPPNDGGFVLEPQVEYAQGTIIYADFASLYPHIMFQCNLYSPTTSDGWSGDRFFELNGKYKNDKLGKVETVLKDLYLKRKIMKENKDPRENAYKLIINTIYGISGCPAFKNIFNINTPGDTTAIGRKMIQYTADEFNKNGYNVLYGDTDSCFIHLPPDKTLDDFKILAKKIVNKIQSHLPFPVDTFKLDIDDVLTHIWLFKKKHYIYINQNNKLIVKGLSIIKHDASLLSAMIFNKLKPRILERKNIKFSKTYIEKLIKNKIDTNITCIGRTYNIKEMSQYSNNTSIQAQICKEYGKGSHFLIPNKVIGKVGKSKKYCTIEESKDLEFDDLILAKVWKELGPFIE